MADLRRIKEPPEGCELWLADLEHDTGRTGEASLTDEEKARACRFVFERDRRRYVSAHAALREVLGLSMGCAPSEVDITVGKFGKPRLAANSGVTFSLSHSGDLALIGISKKGEVGVDIEVIEPLPQVVRLVREHFSDAEREAFERGAEGGADRAFLRVWTRKEACLKAIGWGLTVPPRSFYIGAGNSTAITEVPTELGLVSVAVSSVACGLTHVGAVARLLRGHVCP